MSDRRPTVWRLKTKPRSLEPEQRAAYIRAMLEENFAGTGWDVDSTPLDATAAIEAVERTYPGRAGHTPRRFIGDTRVGDLIWIVDSVNGNYHLARVDAPYHHRQADTPWGREAAHRFGVTWLVKATADETPGGVKNGLRQGTTYCRINDEAAKRYSRLAAGHPIGLDAGTCFLDLLDDEALEDLVGLYLQRELGGALIPSSAKRSTDGYEFVIRSWDGSRSAVAQVKSGRSSPPSTLDAVEHEVYLFSIDGRNPGASNRASIITREQLIEFAHKYPAVLPRTIGLWMDYCDRLASGTSEPPLAA